MGVPLMMHRPSKKAAGFPLGTPGLAAWWDPSDQSNRSAGASGARLLQVNDKSGNNNHLTQSVAAAQPEYRAVSDFANKEAFYFATSDRRAFTSPLANSVTRAYVWIVKPQGALRDYIALFGGDVVGGLELQIDSTGAIVLVKQYVVAIGGTPADVVAADTPIIVAAGYNVNTGDYFIRANGVSRASGTNKVTLDNTPHRMGYARQSNGFEDLFWGDGSECIVLGDGFTMDGVMKSEGYLAHGWGQAGKLPAGHPYKSAPPTT